MGCEHRNSLSRLRELRSSQVSLGRPTGDLNMKRPIYCTYFRYCLRVIVLGQDLKRVSLVCINERRKVGYRIGYKL